MRLFFNYSIDCELPPDGGFGGPATWEVAEASVRGFVEVMSELGLRPGTTLFVYPDVAQKQRALFREMADSGIEIGLHLNTMRYSRMKTPAWLGSLSHEGQLEAIGMARQDVENAIGRPCLGFRACYTSANHATFPVLEELGFEWTSTSGAGRYNADIFQRWAGGWNFPYHPSRKNMLVPGDLKIYEIPITRGIRILLNDRPDRPLDMRAETPPAVVGPGGENFRRIIDENLEEMERRDQPVRAIIGASHNTNPFADRTTHQHRHLVLVCEYAREAADSEGHEFIPASFAQIKAEADRVDAF